MGWNIDKEKTIEVRKNFPKDKDWNRNVEIYCSKDKKSFGKIPKEYQPLMAKFLGKVIGEFVCDRIDEYVLTLDNGDNYSTKDFMYSPLKDACLTQEEIVNYGNGKMLYGWHISDLKIYDKPKELGEFYIKCEKGNCRMCDWEREYDVCACKYKKPITRPPQSWCYVEEIQNG